MKIIYSGFDTICFAVKGALSGETLEHLSIAKEQAQKEQREIPVKLGKDKIQVNVSNSGLQGGYAYSVNTGPVGLMLSFKNNFCRTQWNGIVKIRSANLAVFGWRQAITDALQVLEDIGFYQCGISLNRVDYCMDFLNLGMEFDPTCFVAHARVNKAVHYGQAPTCTHVDKQVNYKSDRVQSITLGKMPGRQIIIYDKRAEAIVKRSFQWFKVWDIDRHDPTQTVHRVELRAGKNELKNFQIVSLEDFETRIGDLFAKAVHVVRYVNPHLNDTNISRHKSHLLWLHVVDHVQSKLLDFSSGVEPEDFLEVIREEKAREYVQQIKGLTAGYAVCLNIEYKNIPKAVSEEIQQVLQTAISNDNGKFSKTYIRAKDRLRFINSN